MVKKRFEQYGTTYQLILMDYKMPMMDGCEATVQIKKYLKENAPAILKPPIIACTTSYSGAAFRKKAQEAGMELFYNKPIFKSTLLRLLAKIGLSTS